MTLSNFEDWFVSGGTPIEDRIYDDVGQIGFVVTSANEKLVCTVLSSTDENDRASIMRDNAEEAAQRGALIALRIGNDKHIFDPRTVLNHGNHDEPYEEERKERGEVWVYFDVDLGCRFSPWFDGQASPTRYGDVTDY